jgi:hypothetical protein
MPHACGRVQVVEGISLIFLDSLGLICYGML